jgi:ribosomal protein S18 acetylase RimI-like enzyme
MRIVRGYKQEDFPRLLEINDACYEGDQRPPEGKFREMLKTSDVWLAKTSDAPGMIGMKTENRVVGFAIVSPTYGIYLWSLAVDPAYQGRGIAGNLLREVFLYYRDKKETEIRLHVHVSNPAQKLYFDQGFRVYDLAPNFYGITNPGEGHEKSMGLMMKRAL